MDVVKEFIKQIPYEKATEEALLSVIDRKRARDYLVIKEFDSLFKTKRHKTTVIYKIIADKYCISYNLVRLIMSQRKENQL